MPPLNSNDSNAGGNGTPAGTAGSGDSPIKDPKRIDLEDPAELEAWSLLLKLSPEDLRAAVGIIGPMSAAVAVYVNSRGRRGQFRQVGEIGHPFERRDAVDSSPKVDDSSKSD